MPLSARLHLFQAYGIELEYMIVDRDTLSVKPIADELLKSMIGNYGSDFENGGVTWSNELVLHVIEIKCTVPTTDFNFILNEFYKNVIAINEKLKYWNAMLMPTAAHPWMNPQAETKLWPHDNNEVYDIYNKIFDCRGHGWSNLQSTHLNLPFGSDEEFGRLHAAIRIVLPLLPALCASSPILDSKLTGFIDTRLSYYSKNQAKLPSITGKVIPEKVFSEEDYKTKIYEKIRAEILPFNDDQILDPVWVNSRGAIARFDRGSIEIRIMDIQECAAADVAIVRLVVALLKALVREELISYQEQRQWSTEDLADIFDNITTHGQNALITNKKYLEMFEVKEESTSARDLWNRIFQMLVVNPENSDLKNNVPLLTILNQGNLAERILKGIGSETTHEKITGVYNALARCLSNNEMYIPAL